MDGKGLSSGSRKRSCRRGQDSGEWRAQRTRFRRPANLLFVPARSKDVAVVKYREGVLPLVLAGFRVDYHVLHPTPGFGSPQQVIAIEVACRIHPQAGIPSPQHGVVVGNGKAAFTILDRVSRELLARAWQAGAGPGDAPFTIDLDSTIRETYGLAKEGARHHGYTGARGYHPLLAIAAGTGDVLLSRLREGRANTARGAAHFLRETVGRVRYAGASGQLTLRADSGFYTHSVVAACRKMDLRFSITIRQHQILHNLIEAIPEAAWTPIPYWMDGAAAVAETTYTPFQSEPDAAPVRRIVRRVKPAPGSQLALFATYSYHGFITDRDGETLELEADHRRHAEIENAIRDLKYGVGLNHMPSGRFAEAPLS